MNTRALACIFPITCAVLLSACTRHSKQLVISDGELSSLIYATLQMYEYSDSCHPLVRSTDIHDLPMAFLAERQVNIPTNSSIAVWREAEGYRVSVTVIQRFGGEQFDAVNVVFTIVDSHERRLPHVYEHTFQSLENFYDTDYRPIFFHNTPHSLEMDNRSHLSDLDDVQAAVIRYMQENAMALPRIPSNATEWTPRLARSGQWVKSPWLVELTSTYAVQLLVKEPSPVVFLFLLTTNRPPQVIGCQTNNYQPYGGV